MFPTFAKRADMTARPLTIVVGAALLACSMAAGAAPAKSKKAPVELEAPVPGAVTVSDFEFNTFVFPDAVKRILFPAGSPVVGKPIYLAENTQVMLQFAKGQDKPVQLVAELEGGQTVTMRVVPKPVPGVTHSVNGAAMRGAPVRKPTGSAAAAAAPRGDDIELLKAVVTNNEPPPGFDAISLPAPTRFDKFSVIPLSGWADGSGKRILVFSLVAAPGQTAVVTPPQFYRPGITAVMVDGDVVDAENSPMLFVIEEMNDE